MMLRRMVGMYIVMKLPRSRLPRMTDTWIVLLPESKMDDLK